MVWSNKNPNKMFGQKLPHWLSLEMYHISKYKIILAMTKNLTNLNLKNLHLNFLCNVS